MAASSNNNLTFGDGFGFGLFSPSTLFKKKYMWLFRIPNLVASGVNALPPKSSARPNISFKPIEVKHVNETINYPGRIEFKPINLVLYDTSSCQTHPIFQWITSLCDIQTGNYQYLIDDSGNSFMQTSYLEMYEPCGGTCIERWQYDNCWAQTTEFGSLDMKESDITYVDITLYYSRAYQINC